jgi:hypothetical protein
MTPDHEPAGGAVYPSHIVVAATGQLLHGQRLAAAFTSGNGGQHFFRYYAGDGC